MLLLKWLAHFVEPVRLVLWDIPRSELAIKREMEARIRSIELHRSKEQLRDTIRDYIRVSYRGAEA